MRTILFVAACAWVGAVAAASTEPRFTNVQVLDGVSEAELYAAMDFMSSSLGVTCEHCHVNPRHVDSRAAKVTARRMVTMARRIHDQSFTGRPVITCESCHQGSVRPAPVPHLEKPAPPSDGSASYSTPTMTIVTEPGTTRVRSARSWRHSPIRPRSSG